LGPEISREELWFAKVARQHVRDKKIVHCRFCSR